MENHVIGWLVWSSTLRSTTQQLDKTILVPSSSFGAPQSLLEHLAGSWVPFERSYHRDFHLDLITEVKLAPSTGPARSYRIGGTAGSRDEADGDERLSLLIEQHDRDRDISGSASAASVTLAMTKQRTYGPQCDPD
jgi:hypothetical protein